jgi:hypothetical protein
MTAENPASIIQDQIIKQDSNPAEPAEAHRYFNLLLEDH